MPTFIRKIKQFEDLDASFVYKSHISIKKRNFGTTFETYLISVRIRNCKGVL